MFNRPPIRGLALGPKLLQQGLVYSGRGVANMRRIGKTYTYVYLHCIMHAMIWCPVVPSVVDAAMFQENWMPPCHVWRGTF